MTASSPACVLTDVSLVTAILFAIVHLCFFLHFGNVHGKILQGQLAKRPRDVLTDKLPYRCLYVMNVYSYFVILNAGLMVTKGIKLTNVLHFATADGHCVNIADWLDWFFHTIIDLSILLTIISVNSSTKRVILICDGAMLICGLVCELTPQLSIQIPFMLVGGILFLTIFLHIFVFYESKKFFSNQIEGLIRGMVALVVFVWTLYPVMFLTVNVIWRDKWGLEVRDSCVAALYIMSKFGFNFLFLAWDKRFQKSIATDHATLSINVPPFDDQHPSITMGSLQGPKMSNRSPSNSTRN